MTKTLRAVSVLWMLVSSLVLQAQRQVRGKVINAADGAVLPGVIILEKGTSNNTLSNINGEYEITVASDQSVLVFSYLGMESQEIRASRDVIDVTMQGAKQLREVVVTALGITRERKALGYGVSEVSGDDVVRSGESNVIQSLAAKAPGIQVTSSGGVPGASSKINIRGNQTFTGNNQPLIVVDGVPIDNTTYGSVASDYPFNENLAGVNNSNRALDINPEDIESVSILKGPAAAALYGQRAGAGAIIYTTKKGKYKRGIGVTLSSRFEFQQVNRLPEFQTRYAQGTLDGNLKPVFSTADPGPDLLFDTEDDVSYGASTSWGPEITEGNALGLKVYDNNAAFFQTGTNYNNQISIDGGTETTMYRFSISSYNSRGVVPNTKLDRTTVRLTGEHKLHEKLRVGTTISYANTRGTKAQNGSNVAGIMLGLLRMPVSYDINNYIYDNNYVQTYFGLYDNPFYTAYRNPFNDNVNRVFGNTYLNYDPYKWLNVTYKVGVDYYNDARRQIYSKSSSGDDNSMRYGQVNYDNVSSFQFYHDLLATGTWKISEDWNSSLTLGNNVWSSAFTDQYSRGRNLVVDDFYNLDNSIDRFTSNTREEIRTYAGFFNAELDRRGAIFLNVTGRNEWSSTFAQGKNDFFYPSVNTSIVLSELLSMPKWFNFAKIRGAYAESGISPVPYRTRNFYTQPFLTDGFTNGNSYPYLGQVGYGIANRRGNPDLKPERVLGTEFGTELRFFDGRIGLDVTYYRQKTVDILIDQPVAPTTGFATQYVNAGEMENRGWEIQLNATPVQLPKFRWDITANWYRNLSEVLSLVEGVDEVEIEAGFVDLSSFAVVNQPYGVFYGTAWQRNSEGKLIINPVTGLPYIDPVRKALGNPFPDWLSGVRNTFTIGNNFSFSFLWDFRKGGKIWNGTLARLHQLGRTQASEDRFDENGNLKMYTIEGVLGSGQVDANGYAIPTSQENNKEVTAYTYFRSYLGDAGGATEQAIFDGSWVRLRELSASYRINFKPNAAGRTYIQYLDFTASANNLLLFTKYDGIDPETSLTGADSNIQGYDYFNNPGVKTYLFGIRAGF